MKQTLFLVLAAALLLAIPSQAQRVAVLKFTDLQQRLARPSDTTYVVNFWATWCAPCVKELPYFEQVRAAYAGRKVKVLLVNLDYASQLEKKVRPFVAKRGLQSEVVLLNEQDPNTWVEKLDATWSGALPFTLLLSTARGKRTAYEQEFTQAELTAAVQKFLR